MNLYQCRKKKKGLGTSQGQKEPDFEKRQEVILSVGEAQAMLERKGLTCCGMSVPTQGQENKANPGGM